LTLYERFVGLRSEPVRNLVERGAVRRFAEAIADPSPLYADEGVAEGAATDVCSRRPPSREPSTTGVSRASGCRLPA